MTHRHRRRQKITGLGGFAILPCLLTAGAASAQNTGTEAPYRLEPLTVEAARESTYAVPNASSATRTNTPVERIPQSVSAIPRKLIDDQGAQTFSDALRNVSSVRLVDERDTNNTNFLVRGFDAAIVVDGIPMPGYFSIPETLVNVNRIEVVKGPGSTLYGGAQAVGGAGFLGGVIAVATKSPERTPYREVGLRIGSYSERGVFFDFNQPLSDQVSVRLVGEARRSESETDRIENERTSIFPSLSWAPNADSQLTVRLRYSDVSTLDYSGLPTRGTVVDAPYSIPRSRIVAAEDMPDTTTETRGININWSQRFNDVWSWALTAAYTQAAVDQRGVFPTFFGNAVAEPGPLLTVSGARLWDEFDSVTISPSVIAKLRSGNVAHTLIAGLDYDRTRDDAFLRLSPDPFFNFGVIGAIDITNPVYPTWVEPVEPSPPDQENRYRSTAVFLQDQVDIGEKLHLLGNLRYTRVKADDVNAVFGVNNHSTNSKLTPRLGVSYEFTPQTSAFIGYGKGMRVPLFAVFSQPPKPEESEQTEIGLRLKNLAGVTATFAIFDLTVKNAIVADPANPGFSIQSGKQRSRGAELDLLWQLNPSWSWLASFTHQDPEVVDDPVLEGKQLFNVPKTSARLATRYDIRSGKFSGLGFGLGLTHHSKLPGDSGNTFFTPTATVWDAQASYAVGRARFALSVNNLADKKYFRPSSYFGGGQVLPATPRTISASVVITF